ncbi:MAG: biopolymer transporter ExbD [Chitinophagaceae bacterium]|nr:biopolymer transporter ExbD [Chitinophagaceae bacterium]
MASIDTGAESPQKKGPGVKKAKKLSTRIDMTPMVDLGFLLITFFVFTATLSSPTTLDLNMPKDVEDEKKKTEVKESGVLTILLGKANQVYYYEGKLNEDASNFKTSSYKAIRDVIINKKKDVKSRYNPANVDPVICEEEKKKAKKKGDPEWEKACEDIDFMVIIKPNADATYKNVVDILDEMTINQVKRYAMVKPYEAELKVIKATEEANGIK